MPLIQDDSLIIMRITWGHFLPNVQIMSFLLVNSLSCINSQFEAYFLVADSYFFPFPALFTYGRLIRPTTQRKPTATQALFALSCTTSTPPPVMLIISRKQLAAGHIRRMNIGLRCTETTQHTRWDNVDDIYAISCVCHRACTKKSRFH